MMRKYMEIACYKWILAAGFLVIAGCGDQSQKDAASFMEGSNAYAQNNYAVAFEKFKPLAEKGHAEAQFNLGVMYRQGRGVEKDDKEAMVWLNKAAEHGHVLAQESVGLSYAKGVGVERDWVQAYKWFSIAAASGKESAMNNKKVIEVHMMPEKIAEANALAQEWLDKRGK